MSRLANSSATGASDLELLRAITASLNHFPHLIATVRQTYRATERPSHREPAFVEWVARYVQFYPTKPLGMLDATHARAFLSHLARKTRVTRARQNEARDAIAFLHVDVLMQSDFTVPEDYVKVTDDETAARQRPSASPNTSFWRLEDAAS